MLATMPARKVKEEADESQSVTVSTRLTPDELRRLDEVAESQPFRPSRSQLIAHAVREFLKQHQRSGK